MLAWHELLTDLAWHEILHRHFRPSQSRKWITALWMINSWQTWSGCVRKVWKTPSSQPFIIFWIQKQAFTHYWHLHGPSLAQQINCDKILFSHTRRWYKFLFLNYFFIFLFFSFFVILCYFVIISFYKNYFTIIILFLFFFFMKIIFIFSCAGIFRDVPVCSVFRVLSTPFAAVRSTIFVRILIFHDIAWEDLQDLRGTSEIYFVATV